MIKNARQIAAFICAEKSPKSTILRSSMLMLGYSTFSFCGSFIIFGYNPLKKEQVGEESKFNVDHNLGIKD